MMEKYGTKNSSPKVDGKRAAKENDSAKIILLCIKKTLLDIIDQKLNDKNSHILRVFY